MAFKQDKIRGWRARGAEGPGIESHRSLSLGGQLEWRALPAASVADSARVATVLRPAVCPAQAGRVGGRVWLVAARGLLCDRFGRPARPRRTASSNAFEAPRRWCSSPAAKRTSGLADRSPQLQAAPPVGRAQRRHGPAGVRKLGRWVAARRSRGVVSARAACLDRTFETVAEALARPRGVEPRRGGAGPRR
jgi:hypothetical protein